MSFDGRFYPIPASLIDPKPVQPGGPPILMDSMMPAGIQRAARIADGLNPIATSYEGLEGTVSGFRAAAQAAGRDPATLPIMVRVNQRISPEPLPADTRSWCEVAPV